MLLDFAGTLEIGATVALLLVGVASTALTRLEHSWRSPGSPARGQRWWPRSPRRGLSVIAILVALFVLPFLTVLIMSTALPGFGRRSFGSGTPDNRPQHTARARRHVSILSGRRPARWSVSVLRRNRRYHHGLFALQVARLAASKSANHPRVLLWNAFGTLDLIVAVAFV